jgi:hypothetical protein
MKAKLITVQLGVLATLSFFLVPMSAAKDSDVDIAALAQESQKASQKGQNLTFVWWISEDFWRVKLAKQNAPAAQAETFLKVLRPYLVVAVVRGDAGLSPPFDSEETIRADTKVLDAKGKSCAPLDDSDIDPMAKGFLQGVIKPMIAKMIGPMGKNMHILLFSAKTADGRPLVESKKKGQFRVVVGKEEFHWRLPFDSVLPKQTCPKCKEECKGSWLFCPWCGTKLSKETASR